VNPRDISVEVPASSANLGPGFDAFAVALDVTLHVRTTPRSAQRVIAEGEGAEELPDDDRNLVWRAFRAYCDRVGVEVPDVSLRSRKAIPLERGMGSSAAAAVAGAALARAVTAAGGRDLDLIEVAAELEGHADNAAAAVLGGLCVAVDGVVRRLEPSSALRPIVCIPHVRQSTNEARALLPEHVTLAEAARNGARAAMVLAGLSGTVAFEPSAMVDVLHEPARLAAMTGSGRLVATLRQAGVGACLSGAGPTVLAIAPAGAAEVVELVREAAGSEFDVRPVAWNRAGATVNVEDSR
jgi:homoserine kinase